MLTLWLWHLLGLLAEVGPAGLLAGTAAVAGVWLAVALARRPLVPAVAARGPRPTHRPPPDPGVPRQRDPDAPGRTRPRAPTAAGPAA